MISNLLNKEFRLSAHIITYCFLAFSCMVFIPNYPLLISAFFICYGIFHSYQTCRDNNDILFSALLPISKKDIVLGKFLFAVIIEMIGLALITAMSLIRINALAGYDIYSAENMLNINASFFGIVFVIFGCFNSVFIGGFFRTAYYFGKPFVIFSILSFVIIIAVETIIHIPGFELINTSSDDGIPIQLAILFSGIALFVLMTIMSFRKAISNFEKTDL